MTEEISKNFLQKAFLKVIEKQTTIFKQYDIGDYMYIIISGSVSIIKSIYFEKINLELKTPVLSLYGGSHFGDLALNKFQTKTLSYDREETAGKRNAEVQTQEQTIFLCINQKDYSNIIYKVIYENNSDILRILKTSPLFKKYDDGFLTIFASYLIKQKYNMGEKIIQKGESLEYFYIVSEGAINQVLEIREKRDLNKKIQTKNQFKTNKQREIQMIEELDVEYQKYASSNIIQKAHQKQQKMGHTKNKNSFFDFDKKEIKDQKIYYNKYYEIKKFIYGDQFGERALFSEFDLNEKKKLFPNWNWDDFYCQHSLCTMVARSQFVEVYTLSYYSFDFLPQHIKRRLKEDLIRVKEFDMLNYQDYYENAKFWSEQQEIIYKDCISKKEVQQANNLFSVQHI